MSANYRFPSFLICTAAIAAAQTTPQPSGSGHSHAPAAGTHTHGVVTLDQFVTSASPFARNQVDLAQATTVLTGQALLLKQAATLGETLATETGIHATSFGPGASRPIIRGLGGDRIRLLENSVGTLDASVVSPDHAVSVEPLLVDRIEVVRGPASLLYGSSAIGGVVNVITHRIETDLPTESIRGAAELRFGSAADEITRGAVADVALQRNSDRAVVLHVDAFRRDAENLRIPGFAESARVRAEETEHALEHGEPVPEFARDRLPNSALESRGGSAGLSFVTKSFHFGASYSGFNSDYGVPGHGHGETVPGGAEGVRIDLRQRRTDVQGEWHGDSGWLRGARVKFGHARYRHAEIEPDGATGTTFGNRGHEARAELLHGEAAGWSGALGAQLTRSNFSAEGDEAFLPPSRTSTEALFAFQEVAQGPLTWQFGGRVERTRIAATGHPSRRETEFGGSAGAVWKLDATHALAVSISHTGRAPNTQELYAAGPHAGTQSYEIGDARLSPERALGLEASFRRRQGFVTGALTVFAHRFDGFISNEPTGLVAVEHDGEWELLTPEEAEEHAGHGGEHGEDALPVYRYTQRDARFWGAELETIWHLHASAGQQWDLRLAADLTRARSAGEHLPRIPAARTTVGLAWASGAWNAGTEWQHVFEQNRVARNETTTDGYSLVSAHVGRMIELGHARLEVFVRGTNLTDEEARPHVSFVKELAPLAGRAVSIGARYSF
jgi:iron complex outermembrane receptor protein